MQCARIVLAGAAGGFMTVVSLAAERRAAMFASQSFPISMANGSASEPFAISLDWSKPQPRISRAVIVFHGVGCDVSGCYRTLRAAALSDLEDRGIVAIACQSPSVAA